MTYQRIEVRFTGMLSTESCLRIYYRLGFNLLVFNVLVLELTNESTTVDEFHLGQLNYGERASLVVLDPPGPFNHDGNVQDVLWNMKYRINTSEWKMKAKNLLKIFADF